MQSNTPVTNNECLSRDTQAVVSKTDFSGNIIYVNQRFAEISGFTSEQLSGARQSIVHHSGMPIATGVPA